MRAYDLIYQFIIELETISALVIMTYIVLFFCISYIQLMNTYYTPNLVMWSLHNPLTLLVSQQ